MEARPAPPGLYRIAGEDVYSHRTAILNANCPFSRKSGAESLNVKNRHDEPVRHERHFRLGGYSRGRILFFKGLKFNIIVSILVMVAVAMLLVNLVLMTGFTSLVTKNLSDKGDLLFSALQAGPSGDIGPATPFGTAEEYMIALSREAGVQCLVLMNENVKTVFSNALCPDITGIEHLLHQSIAQNMKIRRFTGSTRGVFWKRHRYLAVAYPLNDGSPPSGGVGIVFHLEQVYQPLQNIQKVLLTYMFINLALLTLIGYFQIRRITINPLKRILKRAETFREDEETVFLDDSRTDEFGRLSAALHRMLLRISADKARLNETISSLENANAELKQAQREVIRCEKAATVGRLSSGIAHEIGNPLGIILGYLDLLKQKDFTESEKLEFLDRLEQEINRINTIIRQLLDFSRPGMEKSEPVSVHHVIGDMVDVARILPLMRQIDIDFSADAPRDMIMGDESTLRQILLNLLINAADAVSAACPMDTGKISITTRNEEGPGAERSCREWVVVTIEDNGCGISEHDIHAIFDSFFTTKSPGKGTGLGLWVSYMMVENLGGRLEAVRKKEMGAEITVRLPLISTRKEEDNHDEKSLTPSDSHHR
ncbi:MAG: ATP-binding protein [Desulfobacterales bacterium]